MSFRGPERPDGRIRVRCSHCGVVARIDPARIPAGGRVVRCPGCRARFTLRLKRPEAAGAAKQRGSSHTPPAARKGNRNVCSICQKTLGTFDILHFLQFKPVCDTCMARIKTGSPAATEEVPTNPLDILLTRQAPEEKPSPGFRKWAGAMLLVALLFAVFLGWSVHRRFAAPPAPSTGTVSPGGEAAAARQAFTLARQYVRAKIPPGVPMEWPAWEEAPSPVEALADGRYRVTSWYEAQDGTGTRIRQHFACMLRRSGDEWVLEGLEFHRSEVVATASS